MDGRCPERVGWVKSKLLHGVLPARPSPRPQVHPLDNIHGIQMNRSSQPVPVSNSTLHHEILKHFIETGHAPSVDELGATLDQPREVVVESLLALQEYHGVVLHPESPEIWVIHPFSTSPTNFWVESARRSWWGNCAWCSLGIAALVDEDVTITTTLGGESTQVKLKISGGTLSEPDYLVHFPIPMKHAWDNVVFTCSTMLVFDSEASIEDWSSRHRIAVGDIQPISRVWEFAKVWYGRHLDKDWTKWSVTEARAIFEQFGLTGRIWDLPAAASRF